MLGCESLKKLCESLSKKYCDGSFFKSQIFSREVVCFVEEVTRDALQVKLAMITIRNLVQDAV